MFEYNRVSTILDTLRQYIVVESIDIEGFVYKKVDYKTDNIIPNIDSSFTEIKPGERWGLEKDAHFWFIKKITVPCDDMELKLITGREGQWDAKNPQFIVYVDGKLVQAFDTNHITYPFAKAGEYTVALYGYSGSEGGLIEFIPTLNKISRDVEKLYYDIKVPHEICNLLEAESLDYLKIVDVLNDGINLLDLRKPNSPEFYASVAKADKKVSDGLAEKCKSNSDITAVCIGHTHIDIAWLWTVKQTREKAVRSFSTVIQLMRQYPEYKFMSSQAILFKMIKEDAPELYEEIKEMVKVGRFEIEGAMWVEADCNLTGGESLIRQILYGKRFFQKEFGVDCKMLWLPDVFGYSAALPQILKKSGVETFVTSKISWNETNLMPNDTFMWQGIDGSEVFTYFMTAQDKRRGEKPSRFTTYNADITPAQVAGTWERYQNKLLNDEVLITFGHGDGGGGPTKKMLEYSRRLTNGVLNSPKVRMDTATNFMEKLKKKSSGNSKLPKWVGELYLELHRGTYTSIAKNKRNNRKGEFLLKDVELLSSINLVNGGDKYAQSEINSAWEILMTNQFHDIIPGSSIKEVYDESDISYGVMFATCNTVLKNNQQLLQNKIKTNGGILVFNSNSFVNSDVVEIDGKMVYVSDVPAMGYKVVQISTNNDVIVGKNLLENSKVKVLFDETMNITSIFDKDNQREVLSGIGNKLVAYEDYPKDWDAWEISDFYKQKFWNIDNVDSVSIIDDGDVKGFKVIRRFQTSTIEQKILLNPNSSRVDFDTHIDWHEEHILVKVDFPVDVHTNKATYNVQYGTVERGTHQNTSWDMAKFEVCAHKFADLSEPNFGVSLMNDCKYGYDILGNKMSLTLLKCSTMPNPEADKGEHNFIYAIYPHSGDYRESTVIESYKLNSKMTATKLDKQDGTMDESYSFASVNRDNIIIESVKKAEDSNDIIVRFYDTHGIRSNVDLQLGVDVKKACLVDLMENSIENVQFQNNKTNLTVKPYEIVSIKVTI